MLQTAIALLIVSVGMWFVPRPHRLAVVAALFPLQLFLPGTYLSLAEIAALAAAMCLLMQEPREVASGARAPLVTLFGVLAVTSALALSWTARSSLMSGTNVVIRLLIFLSLLVLLSAEIRGGTQALRRPLLWAAPGVVFQAMLCVLFIALPEVENAYLRSPVAAIFGGNAVGSLFAGEPNNVLDPLKSGGFFVNGNVASMFGFVASLVFAWGALRWRSIVFASASIASAVGALATGSKTPLLVLPLVMILIVASVWRFLRRGVRRTLAYTTAAVCTLLVIAVAVLPAPALALTRALAVSVLARNGQWELLPQAWRTSPLLGLGYDGWARMAEPAIGQSWPPHNLVLRAWADGGIPNLAAMIAVIVLLAVLGVRSLRFATNARDALQRAVCVAAALWIVVHGMGDNTTIYGGPRTSLFAAIAMIALWHQSSRLNPAEYDSANHERSGAAIS